MPVLVLDTALNACQAVVGTADGRLAVERCEPAQGRAEAIVSLADKALASAGVDYQSLSRIAVTVGPGSFTGLRIGVAAARGLGLVTGCPVVGLSSLAALAASVLDAEPDLPRVALVDARHDAAYGQVFAPDLEPISPARHASLDDFAREIPDGALLIGSGALPAAGHLEAIGRRPGRIEPLDAPSADAILRLAVAAVPPFPPPRPLYLKAPDARPAQPLLGRGS